MYNACQVIYNIDFNVYLMHLTKYIKWYGSLFMKKLCQFHINLMENSYKINEFLIRMKMELPTYKLNKNLPIYRL